MTKRNNLNQMFNILYRVHTLSSSRQHWWRIPVATSSLWRPPNLNTGRSTSAFFFFIHLFQLIPALPLLYTQLQPTTFADSILSLAMKTASLKKLNDYKAPGTCIKIFFVVILNVVQWLICISNYVYMSEELPNDCTQGIVLFWKWRDNRLSSNHRNITLLSIPGKIFTKILLNQPLSTIKADAVYNKPDSCQINSLSTIFERSWEFHKDRDLYLTFVNFKVPFDTVDPASFSLSSSHLSQKPHKNSLTQPSLLIKI